MFAKFARLLMVPALWLACAVAYALPPAHSEELSLAVGENRTIPAVDVKSYSEGAPGVADVKVTPGGNQFVIVGQKPGSTTLLTIRRDGTEVTWNINVFARPVQAVESELRELLGDQTGIRVKKIGARFFIEGGVSSEADLGRIEHIAKLYDGQVESLVTLGGAAAERKINIRVDFYFVQYDRTRVYQLGVSWPGAIAGNAAVGNFAYDFLKNATTTAQAAISNQPLPGLDIAARNGWAKVLKHATVITSNGAEALFSNGGVQNYQIINGFTASIQQIRFGTNVKVLPRFDPTSREIAVAIEADVADLTPAIGETKLPGQNLSKLATNVALKLGQSVVLSGIRTQAQRRANVGIPGLSEIPILGLLFGSQGDERQDVEGALFIVPSVIDTSSARASELIERAVAEFANYKGNLEKVAPFDEKLEAADKSKSVGGR